MVWYMYYLLAQNRPLAQLKNALNKGVSRSEGSLETEVLVSPRSDLLSQLGVFRDWLPM